MKSPYLDERLDALRKAQNADGGWSYYAGKQASWLEPTAYAAMALNGEPAADRAWELFRSWQQASGGWRPAAQVPGPNWTTALAVLVAQVQKRDAGAVGRGVEWLRNAAQQGAWAWRPGNAGSAEASALALVALARAGGDRQSVEKLLRGGSDFLLGTQVGPETCGPVLVGLQGTSEAKALTGVAALWARETPSELTRAWITLGLRLNGVTGGDPGGAVHRNLAVVALEALAAEGGNHELFRAEVAA